MSKKIVVIGSSNTDMILRLPQIPRPGETLLGGQFSKAAGGKGANQAVAVARAGGDITFIAKVGDDAFGDDAVVNFKKEGIDVSSVFVSENQASGLAFIFVDDRGENSIGVAGGANDGLSVKDIEGASAVLGEAEYVLLQLETPLETVTRAVEIASSAGSIVVLNPAPARQLPKSLLSQLDIITPNQTEAELLTGVAINNKSTAEQAAKYLLESGVKIVIITLGSAGALVANADEILHIPSFVVKAVDTTAAGDTFNGALVVALSEGMGLKESVRFAQAAASISVTRAGAQPSIPTRAEIDEKLKG